MNRSSSRSSASRKSPSNVRSPAKTKRRRKPESGSAAATEVVELKGTAGETGGATDVVRDGFLLDFISGTKEVKETPKELVRQRIARALFHEYGISVDDMAAGFPVQVGGRRRRVDVAIFATGETHEPENIQRVVVCRPEPKQNKRGAVKMRDYEQAAHDIADVKPFFEEITACKYALWTQRSGILLSPEEGDEVSGRCRADRRLAPRRRVHR